MFGQPRCREWTPLATQQLRLRSLLQIVGYNMYGNDGSSQPGSLYYTLHSTMMSAPFYTSEKLLSIHPKWREIDSEMIHRMSSLNVVVRVWRHVRSDDADKRPDTIIQTWGVNFSGMMYIGANLNFDYSPKSFMENTLVFQMSGGYFCSYEKIKLSSLPKKLQVLPDTKKKKESSQVIPIDNKKKHAKESKSVSPNKNSKSDTDKKTISKSHSPSFSEIHKNAIINDRKLSFKTTHESARERAYCDCESVYEHSPKNEEAFEIREYLGSENDVEHNKLDSSGGLNRDMLSVDESEAAENFDSNLQPVPKYRYVNMDFLASEIRPSYNASKLSRLHRLQYSIKNRLEAVQEIKEKIYQKSPMENCENPSPHDACIDYEGFCRSENLSVSCREYSLMMGKNKQNKCTIFDDEDAVKRLDAKILNDSEESTWHDKSKGNKVKSKYTGEFNNITEDFTPTDRRFTMQLNKLLELNSQPSPSQRLRYSYLTKQVELSRFRMRLLKDERDAALCNIRKLKGVHSKLFEENQDNGTDLMQKYHSLSKKWDQLKELRKSEAALRELCLRSTNLLQSRRWSLVQDIQIIFPITENSQGKLCILDIHLPACQNAGDGLKQVPEATLAVALGLVSHAAAMAASLLSVPLRHPVRLMGSRTKIVDHLATQQNEIPLFARNKDSMMFRYGLFLLNRNIAQLLWATHRFITPDPRDTLTNLQRLLTPPPNITDLETSKIFGSTSSVETVGGNGYSLTHPLSAPTLNSVDLNMLHHIGSTPSNLGSCAIRKNSPYSLRSLVAVGADRSSRNIIASGGFNNTGNRQFNRFKECVDGHSPKAAMVIRKHRCSRSVGSYPDEQSLQSYEFSPSTAVGSEPSLLIHCDAPLSDVSDSPSENVENAISLSESDLTKVSDLTSPDVNETKVVFSVGDDEQLSDGEREPVAVAKRIPKQRSLEEVPSSSYKNKCKLKHQVSVQNTATFSKENVEIQSLQLDVHQLRKELEKMCSNCSPEDASHDMLDSEPLSFSKCNVESPKESSDILMKNSDTPSKQLDVAESITDKNSDHSDRCNSCCTDIEGLDSVTYCSHPCSRNCSKAFEKLSEADSPRMADGEESNDEGMQDVIVLPSAEAVLTSGSHFTDSLDLDEVTIEESNSEGATLYRIADSPKCSKSLSIDDINTIDSAHKSGDSITRDDSVNSSDEKINDWGSIHQGDTASKDANELLQSIMLMEETQSTSDLPEEAFSDGGTLARNVVSDNSSVTNLKNEIENV